MAHWPRYERLAAISKERGLKTKGFRRNLRDLVDEFSPRNLMWDDYSREDFLDDEFGEWFGDCKVAPAAHRILRDTSHFNEKDILSVTVEVYEVEVTAELSDKKWAAYGLISAGDGPNCELHIIDKHENEIVVPNELLSNFEFFNHIGWDGELVIKDPLRRELSKLVRSKAYVQHHTVLIPDESAIVEKDKEIKNLKKQMMDLEKWQIAAAFQEIIYGLGDGRPYKEIAQHAGVSQASVKAAARLLKEKSINPRLIVKDTHARWKAAYDAVRELGIQL